VSAPIKPRDDGRASPLSRATIAWGMFDWANTPYAVVVLTFVFATYFAQSVAPDPVTGTSAWGYALSASAVMIAVASPVIGALADRRGGRKPWLAGTSVVLFAVASLLWFVRPQASDMILALVLVAVGNLAFEVGSALYNAMLPGLVRRQRVGTLSGLAQAAGYVGGLACLLIALQGLIQADPPPFGLDKERAEHVRAVSLLVAAWFAIFALPLFLFTPQAPPAPATDAGSALTQIRRDLLELWRTARADPRLGRFLIANMLYIDGLNTLFAFGGIYAAGSFGMSIGEVLEFGIMMNIAAGLGAAGMAWLDDRIGSIRLIRVALVAMIILGTAILLVSDKTSFLVVGLAMGLFLGPLQSASRSHMAHLAPPALSARFFGLLALAGKATAFLGPLVLAIVTDLFASQRAGMATILVFFVAGLALTHGLRPTATDARE
jgi:UMF1 family MFS transporter